MKVSVIGQGYVGFPLSMAMSSSGMRVQGVDSNLKLVSQINQGLPLFISYKQKKLEKFLKAKLFSISDKLETVSDSEVIILCLPTPLDSSGKPDISSLKQTLTKLRKYISPNCLVILESTVASGTARSLSSYLNKNKENKIEFDFAYSPERIDPLNKKWDVKNTPKLVAGLTDKARDRAVEFYSKFIDTVIPCSSLEVAETAKLLENSFRLINISFINELAIFCNKIGIDVQEVIKAASTKPYGFMPFYPSVGIGGHCIPVDPVYLSHKAKQVGAPTRCIDLATKVNHEMPKYFVKRASQMLGKVKNKKVLVLGVSYKQNISDVRETPVEALIDGLRKKGAKVKWHDEIVKKWRGEKSAEITDKYDLAIIATPHDYFDLKNLGKTKILNTRSSI
jgi:UDP-N-acetyl-D-glucosamine dehydrogenase